VSSGRNRRKATLPTAAYVRPDAVDETGLVFTLFGESGGVEGTWDFSRLAGSLALKQALAAGFARLAGPSARWRAWDTCTNGYYAIRRFTRHLADLERPPRSAAEIAPAVEEEQANKLIRGRPRAVGVVPPTRLSEWQRAWSTPHRSGEVCGDAMVGLTVLGEDRARLGGGPV
jgi:hypothetical protein